MSSNPLKLKIKISKAPENAEASKPAGVSAAKGKKRKAAPGQSSERQKGKQGAAEEDLEGRQSKAERDYFAEAKRPRGDGQASDRAREGNQAHSPKPEQHGKPRLVIKGSFGKAGQTEPGQGSKAPGQAKQADGAVDGQLPQKKKKKKKKLRGTDAQPGQPIGVKLKVKSPQLAKSAAKKARPEFLNALPSKGVKEEATHPPAKPSQLHPAPTDSQAPSTMTGLSEGGHAVSSMPSGPAPGHAPGEEASSAAVPRAAQVPAPGQVEQLLTRLQKKDPYQIFKDPVTDAVAPGYSSVIKRPMSFSQMHSKLQEGAYATWDPVQADLETMFNNAMVFNAPTTPYHTRARELMGVAKKMLHTLKTTGQLDARGRKTGVAPKAQPAAQANQAPLPERRTERRSAVSKQEKPVKPKVDKKKAAAKKAAASGVLARPNYEDGRGDQGPLSAEENLRSTFWPLVGSVAEQQWKGLAKGSSGSGVAFSCGRPALRANYSGNLTLEAYLKSLRAFGANLRGAGKALLEAKCQAASKIVQRPLPVANPSSQPSAPQVQAQMPKGAATSSAPVKTASDPRPSPANPTAPSLLHNSQGQKSSGPSVATPASLYAGMQALSAANLTAVASAPPAAQQIRPAAWSLGSETLSRPGSASSQAKSRATPEPQQPTMSSQSFGSPHMLHPLGGQHQRHGQPGLAPHNSHIVQPGSSFKWTERFPGLSSIPAPSAAKQPGAPVEWQPLRTAWNGTQQGQAKGNER